MARVAPGSPRDKRYRRALEFPAQGSLALLAPPPAAALPDGARFFPDRVRGYPYPTILRGSSDSRLLTTLLSQDAMVVGGHTFPDQVLDLNARVRAAVARTALVSGNALLTTLFGQDRIYGDPGEVPTYTWTVPTGPRRPVDLLTFLESLVTTTLAGQDLLYGDPGQVPAYLYPNPSALRRPLALADMVSLLNTVLAPAPAEELPPGQATSVYALRPPARRALDAFSVDLLLTLLAPAAPEEPPVASQRALLPSERARLAAIRASLELARALALEGQDQVYGDPGEAPAYDWQNPIGARRIPLRLDLAALSGALLVGQDVIYAGPGQAPAYDWPLPIPRAPGRWNRAHLSWMGDLLISAPAGTHPDTTSPTRSPLTLSATTAAGDGSRTTGAPGASATTGAYP